MRIFTLIIFAFFPLWSLAQKSPYSTTSFLTEGAKVPNTHYLGEAWLSSLLQGDSTFEYNITKATFKANSTLDWHKHASAQVLIILEGEAYYQERGKDAFILKTGDLIKCPKDTEHWHSSTKQNSVTYLAIYSGTQPTTWTEKLSQEYYDKVAASLKEK